MISSDIPLGGLNQKHREGLTSKGLTAHIASSIVLRNMNHGTVNDCKHSVAHNLRALQWRLVVEKEVSDVWITADAKSPKGRQIELEHAIPVGCLMNLLFGLIKTTDVNAAICLVDELVRDNTVLVWVTKAEHAKLNKKYQSTMPEGFDTYPWRCKLARYSYTPEVSALSKKHDPSDARRAVDDDLHVEIDYDFQESSRAPQSTLDDSATSTPGVTTNGLRCPCRQCST